MYSFTLVCKLRYGGHIWLNRKIVPPAATTDVVWLSASSFNDSSWARAEKPLITYMHLAYLSFMFICKLRHGNHIGSKQNWLTCSNYRCCGIVCTRLHWFLSSQSWETFDHIHASLISRCKILRFYANFVIAAIFDLIGKLFHLQQLQ